MILCSHRQHAHCTQLSPDLIKVSRTCGLTGKLRPCKTRPRAISALCQYPAHLHVQRSVSALLAALQTTSRHRVHQHRSYSLCPASALIMYFCPRREASPLIFFFWVRPGSVVIVYMQVQNKPPAGRRSNTCFS